jgi:hypothetical protein
MGPCIVIIFLYISNKMQRYTVYFIWKPLYMFRVVPPPIVRNANNFIYSIWCLSHRYCYLPLSWKSWNWFECAQHTQTYFFNYYQERIHLYLQHLVFVAPLLLSAAIVEEMELRCNGVTNTRCCRYTCMRS